MKKTNLSKQSLVFFLISVLVIISFLSGIPKTNAVTTEYLQWEGSSQGVGGYIEIADFPEVLTIGETYKINAKFTVEILDYADAVEFGKVEWLLKTSPTENYTIGYSSVDANITKHQQNSTISHWAFPYKPASGSGLLTAIATINLINCTEPDKTTQTISMDYGPIITLRVESNLKMSNSIVGISDVRRGSTIILNGTLTAYQGKTIRLVENITNLDSNETTTVFNETVPDFRTSLLNIEVTDPNGHKTNQSTNTNYTGAFSFRFTPNATGIWYITAYYDGSPYFLPSTSDVVVVHVVLPDPTVLWIVISFVILFILTPNIVQKLFRKQKKDIIKNNSQAEP